MDDGGGGAELVTSESPLPLQNISVAPLHQYLVAKPQTWIILKILNKPGIHGKSSP